MYITDFSHFLAASGAIGPVTGPGLKMANFHADVVAHASNATGQSPAAPKCFKCRKCKVEAAVAQDSAIAWSCSGCGTEGRISNWQRSLWDLSDRPAPRT